MKKHLFTLLLTFVALVAFADVPWGKPRTDCKVTIVLPQNNTGWKYYYALSTNKTTKTELTAAQNVVTLSGRGRPETINLYAVNTALGSETKKVDIWGAGTEKFFVVDSVAADKIYYQTFSRKEYDKYLKQLKKRQAKASKAKPGEGSYNTTEPEIKYYKADGPGPIILIIPALFVLIIIALVALIVFIVRRYNKNKKR